MYIHEFEFILVAGMKNKHMISKHCKFLLRILLLFFLKHSSVPFLFIQCHSFLVLKILIQLFDSMQSYKLHTAIHVIAVPLPSFLSYLGT